MKMTKEWLNEKQIWYEKYQYYQNRLKIIVIIAISIMVVLIAIPVFNDSVWYWQPPLSAGTGWYIVLMLFVFLIMVCFVAILWRKITVTLIFDAKKLTHNGFVFYEYKKWLFPTVDDVEYFVENRGDVLANKDEEFLLGVDYFLTEDHLSKKQDIIAEKEV